MGGEGNGIFWLGGIDFPGYEFPGVEDEIDRILKSLTPGSPLIFLSYDPDLAPILIDKGADLVLSGDGMQRLQKLVFADWRLRKAVENQRLLQPNRFRHRRPSEIFEAIQADRAKHFGDLLPRSLPCSVCRSQDLH